MSEGMLAELVAARICHDLVSPVGAIANIAEMMEEIDAGEAGEEMALVRQSAARASALLQLQRLAFGPADADGEPVARGALAAELEGALAGRRVAVSVDGTEGRELAPPVARLAALLALAGRQLLGLGGRLSLTIGAGDGLPLALRAEGEGAGVSDDAAALIEGAGSLPEARAIELALLPLAARAAGARITHHAEAGAVRLEARRG